MSTKALRRLLEEFEDMVGGDGTKIGVAARKAIAAIEQAAKDLTRLHLDDFTDDIAHRDSVVSAMTTPESQWDHPDVKAWSDAARLLAEIAKDAK